MILRVKCSYFEIVITVNRPYFVPCTIPYDVFKFSTVPLVTRLSVTQRVTLSWINRLLFVETWAWNEPVLILVCVLIPLRISSVSHRLYRWPLVLAVTEIIGTLRSEYGGCPRRLSWPREDCEEVAVARRQKSLRDQVEGASGIVYIFSIFTTKYFSHGFL